MTNFTKILTNELAQRLYDLDIYGAQDCGETPETIARMLEISPLAVIEYLVSVVEDLQA